jgi:ParB family chromosome partitioning protein
MSENTTTAEQAEAAEYVRREVGRLEYLDPRTLVVDPFNHRKERDGQPIEPDADLIASVEALGVHTPITVRPQADGDTLGVIAGQRRLLAAQRAAAKATKAGKPVPLIPALVRDDLAGVDDDALVMSVIENTQRRAATTRDTVEALSLLDGMELTTVQRKRHAKALGVRPEEIAAARKVAELDDRAMREAVNSFDLVEAAEYAEVAELSDARWKLQQAKREDADAKDKGRGHWKHCLEQLRQRLADRQARAALEEELRGNAVTIVSHRYTWNGSQARPLTDLLTAAGKTMTRAHHAKTCQHHAASIDPDKVRAVWMCADWREAGHQLTPKAAETAREPEQVSREEAAAERRAVIEGNKAWRAARTVRQQFIADLIAAKSGISDAAWLLTLRTISGTSYLWHHFTGRRATDLVAKFLGVPDPNEGRSAWDRIDSPFEAVIGRTSKGRRGSFLFAQVAAAWEEDAMGDRAWRDGGDRSATAEWLTFLRAEGYTLSEIEARALASATPADQLSEAATGTAAPEPADVTEDAQASDVTEGEAPDDPASGQQEQSAEPQHDAEGEPADRDTRQN